MVSLFASTPEDLWALHDLGWYVVDPTNLTLDAKGRNVMGAGISRQVAERYPETPDLYGQAIVRKIAPGRQIAPGRALGPIDCVGRVVMVDHDHRIVFLPTKYHWRRPSVISLLDRGLQELAGIMREHREMRVAMPRIGAGLGGLDWPRQVLPLIEGHLGEFADRVTLVDPPLGDRR